MDDELDGVGVVTNLGILRPGPEPPKSSRVAGESSRRSTHRRKRSRYYEAEVHSSEATVQSDDRPSARLDKQSNLMEAIGRKSMHHYTINPTQNPTPTGMYTSNNASPMVYERFDSLTPDPQNSNLNEIEMSNNNGSVFNQNISNGPRQDSRV